MLHALITRAGWNARPPRGTGNALNARPRGVRIHWEGSPGGPGAHAGCAAAVRRVQQFHTDPEPDGREWADIAYNFLVCPHGYVFEGRGVRKGSAANGTTEANAEWYAVCALVGPGDEQSPELHAGIRDAVAICQGAGAGPEVGGHRDGYATECPGDELAELAAAGAFNPSAPVKRPATATVKHRPAVQVPAFPGTTRRGSKGAAVRAAQARLAARGWSLAVDGDFGKGTEAVVRAFQAEKHLAVDGIVGRNTWQALWTAPVTR